MNRKRLLWRFWRDAFRRSRLDDDLDEEIRAHVALDVEHRVERGEPPHEARRQALVDVRGIAYVKEATREARAWSSAEQLVRDLSYASRRLARDWRFSLAASVILSLGIGANVAIFSAVNSALFRDPSVAEPDRLVDVYQNYRDGSVGFNSYPAYRDVAEYTDVFAGVTAATLPDRVDVLDEGGVRGAMVEFTSASYPSVMGLGLSQGRWFTTAEDSPDVPLVAIVGHRTWRTRFDADPSIVGRTLRIEGTPVTIVGVAPAGFNGTVNVGLITDFWIPIASRPAILGRPPEALEQRSGQSSFIIKARLHDGVTVAEARAAMDVLGARLASEYPDEDPGRGITVIASSDVRVHPRFDVLIKALATALLTVAALVLAIACSNLATLLLVRGTARAKEGSIRQALGASRWQLVRHLLTESILLAAAGGAGGCIVAWWGIRAIGGLDLPIAVDFGLDVRVLGYAMALSFVTGVAFGLAPALTSTKVDLLPTLRDDGGSLSPDRRWFTLKNGLVVFQVTVSIVLLSTAGVFFKLGSIARAQPRGFTVDGVAVLETDPRFAGYSAVEANAVYEELRRRVGAIPGVQALALVGSQPMATAGSRIVLEQADSDATVEAVSIMAGPGFFETFEIPIPFGRALDERDLPDAPTVAVISASMAREYFGDVNAVGRRFRVERDPNWIEVVGVARDTKTVDPVGDLVDPMPYLYFRASAQWNRPPNVVVARTSLDAASLVGAMQRELRGIDGALPVLTARTMAQTLETAFVSLSTVATVLSILGALGLGLAGIGLYAIVSFAVWRRSREIGICMALGARAGQVAWGVVRHATVLMGAGAVIGLGLSIAVTLAIGTLSLPRVGFSYRLQIDPLALAAIVGFIAMVGVLAAVVPARRAVRMDPLAALRRD